MQQLLLKIAAEVLPILALFFVSALLAYTLYINVRSRFNIKVNCWFCNGNTRVAYADRNSWTCPQCEQYNGFNKDGDYNRDILHSDLNGSRGSAKANNSSSSSAAYCSNDLMSTSMPLPPPSNGLCDQCNEAQRLKVEKLAQFEPKHESRFDRELKQYKTQLEQQFSLCASCERHVHKVLNEKKKMVLGSKFVNFIVKAANLMKQPHFKRLALVEQQRRLRRLQLVMSQLTLLNLICLLWMMPPFTRSEFNHWMGETMAQPFYFIYSHTVTLLRVLSDYAGHLLEDYPSTDKLLLFGRTFGKMLLFSVGFNQLQAQQATFSSCFTSIYPHSMLALSFLHNIGGGFKFSRFTLLLVMWSVYAKSSLLEYVGMEGVTFILLGSLITLALLLSNRANSLLQLTQNESVGDSFHRLCQDECISDDETISMLSQQLNCSANGSENRSINRMTTGASIISSQGVAGPQLRQRMHNLAPSVLSLDSLRLSSQPSAGAQSPTYQTQVPSIYRMPMNSLGWQRGLTKSVFDFNQQQPLQHQQQTQRRSTSNLLMPSRLQQQRNGDICAWVDATSANQHPDILQEPNTANLMHCHYDKQLSRASSQSSGFESQLGNHNRLDQAASPSNASQFWTLPQLPQQQPRAMSEYGMQPDLSTTTSQHRTLRVPQELPSPTSTASRYWSLNDHHLGQKMPAQNHLDIQPGDLLRNWMDRNVGASLKTNRKI